jgi:hypothetical protein
MALITKETITRFSGRNTPKLIFYPASAAAGFLLAVCSCTVIPLFAGIYKKGAGIVQQSLSCLSRLRLTFWHSPIRHLHWDGFGNCTPGSFADIWNCYRRDHGTNLL